MALCSAGAPPVSDVVNGLGTEPYQSWGKDEDFDGDYSVAAAGTRKNGTGTIRLKDIPDGAEIVNAYLIYNTYQANVPVAHPTVYLDAVDVTALSVRGVCGSTCWYNPGPEATTYLSNRVYVSPDLGPSGLNLVDGNDDYDVTGLPTSAMRIGTDGDRIPGCLCSQGALLFVVWKWGFGPSPDDPVLRSRAINLYVGARLLSNNPIFGATPSYNLPFQPVQSTVDMNFFKGNSHIEVAAGDTQASIPGDSFVINQVRFIPPNNTFTKTGSSISLRKYNVAQIYDGENSAFARTSNDCICWFFFAISGDKTSPKAQFQIVNCCATYLALPVTPEATEITVESNFVQDAQTLPIIPPTEAGGYCRAVAYQPPLVLAPGVPPPNNTPGMFPAAAFYIKIDNEIMKVKSKTGEFINTGTPPLAAGQLDQRRWQVERGQAGTAAVFHTSVPGDGRIKNCVYMLAPAKFIKDMQAGLAPKGRPNQRPAAGNPQGKKTRKK